MKKVAANTFAKGLITDLNPLTTPPDVLIEARNIDFITTEGDQIILQKRMGNDPELWIEGENQTIVTLTPGYIPLMVKELNNVAYIISYKDDAGVITGEIGTFPSPDYDKFEYTEGGTVPDVVATITSVWDDGIASEVDFDFDPPLVENKIVQYGVGYSELYTITNNSDAEDTINVVPDPEYLSVAPNVYTVAGNDTADLPVVVIGNIGYIPSIKVLATSLTDPTVSKESEWTNLTIWEDPDNPSRKDWYSHAQYTGDNIENSGVWKPLATAPVMDIYMGYPPGYPHKSLQLYFTHTWDDGGTVVYSDYVPNLDVYSATNIVAGVNSDTLTLAGSTYLRVAAADIESALVHTPGIFEEALFFRWEIFGTDPQESVTFKGDVNYGDTVDYALLLRSNPSSGTVEWQWQVPTT